MNYHAPQPHPIGGSILPSSDPFVLQPKTGEHGTFETRPLPELDTYGLFYARSRGEFAGHFVLVASHPNGYSCDELAKRIIAAWESGDTSRAMSQFDYVLQCGGLGKSRESVECIARGEW